MPPPQRRRAKVHRVRGKTHQTLMRPGAVVELAISPDLAAGLGNRAEGMQIHVLVRHAAPQPLDEHVVYPAPAPVHVVLMSREHSAPVKSALVNWAPLVGVEDFRGTIVRQRTPGVPRRRSRSSACWRCAKPASYGSPNPLSLPGRGSPSSFKSFKYLFLRSNRNQV